MQYLFNEFAVFWGGVNNFAKGREVGKRTANSVPGP